MHFLILEALILLRLWKGECQLRASNLPERKKEREEAEIMPGILVNSVGKKLQEKRIILSQVPRETRNVSEVVLSPKFCPKDCSSRAKF